ncbi:unnamed protein product [Colias eurytheme]|nr:unnamed protein product [Colias eurytheme]
MKRPFRGRWWLVTALSSFDKGFPINAYCHTTTNSLPLFSLYYFRKRYPNELTVLFNSVPERAAAGQPHQEDPQHDPSPVAPQLGLVVKVPSGRPLPRHPNIGYHLWRIDIVVSIAIVLVHGMPGKNGFVIC